MFEQARQFFVAGGWVMYPLSFLSIWAGALIIERSIYWLIHRTSRAQYRAYLDLLGAGLLKDAANSAVDDRSPVGRLVAQLTSQNRVTEATALATVESLRPPIERSGATLAVIIAAAPLLGILGTVTGIIDSFDLLGAATGISDPAAVAGGIAEALFTTALGLSIALICLFPHAAFRAASERTLSRLESVAAIAADQAGS